MHVSCYLWFVGSVELNLSRYSTIHSDIFYFPFRFQSHRWYMYAIYYYHIICFWSQETGWCKIDKHLESINKLGGILTQRTKLCYSLGEGMFWQGDGEKDRQKESDRQEQSCLELIFELKLAQDGGFQIHVAFKQVQIHVLTDTKVIKVPPIIQHLLYMLKQNGITI